MLTETHNRSFKKKYISMHLLPIAHNKTPHHTHTHTHTMSTTNHRRAYIVVAFDTNVRVLQQPAPTDPFDELDAALIDTSGSTGTGPLSASATMRSCLGAFLSERGHPPLKKPLPAAGGRTKMIEAMVVAKELADKLCAARPGSVRGTTAVFTDGWENDSFLRIKTLAAEPLAGPEARALYDRINPTGAPRAGWRILDGLDQKTIADHVAYFADKTNTNLIICVGETDKVATLADTYNAAAMTRNQMPLIASVATKGHWDPSALKDHMKTIVGAARKPRCPKTTIVHAMPVDGTLKMPKPGTQAHAMMSDFLFRAPQKGTSLTIDAIPTVIAECNGQANNKCWHPIGKPGPNLTTVTAVATHWCNTIEPGTPFTVADNVKDLNKLKGGGGIPKISTQDKSALNSVFANFARTYPETIEETAKAKGAKGAVAYLIKARPV